MQIYPQSQGQLIKAARGELSQKAFAAILNVDRTCLSRYENEVLGAPTAVLNHCLQVVASKQTEGAGSATPVQMALKHVREAVNVLELASRA